MSSLTPTLNSDVTLSLTLPSSPIQNHSLVSQQRGIRLIQLLLKCVHHATSGNLNRSDGSLAKISDLSSVSGDSMQRLAARFASALTVRLVKRWPGLYNALNHAKQQEVEIERVRHIFSQAFPYLGFAYAIIARALVHAMAHERVVHIVDLGSVGDSKLWVSLLRGLARLTDTPPHIRVTCANANKVVLEKLGQSLAKEAEALDLPFQFNALHVSLRNLNIDMLKVRSGEALALISILSLHVLLAEDDSVDAHFCTKQSNAGIKDYKQMRDFLAMIRSMSPKLLFLVGQEADHNINRLVDRFAEGLHYYSALFDSIDMNSGNLGAEERMILEEMFGKEIENIVACEGMERIERHERCGRWMVRFSQAGFKPVQLWLNLDEDCKHMVDAFGKDGYNIISERTSIMMCWHNRPLYAVTAWTC